MGYNCHQLVGGKNPQNPNPTNQLEKIVSLGFVILHLDYSMSIRK